MTYWGPIDAQAAYLANVALPAYGVHGFSAVAAKAWLLNEGQATPNPTNPLNIAVFGGGSGSGLETGHQGGYYTYASWQEGLTAAAYLLTHNSAYRHVVASAATNNPLAQAAAVEGSPWAGGNYGARVVNGNLVAPGHLQATVGQLLGGANIEPASSPAPKPAAPSLTHAALTPAEAQSTLSHDIGVYEAIPSGSRSPAQAKALATDLATYERQFHESYGASAPASSPVAPAPAQTPAVGPQVAPTPAPATVAAPAAPALAFPLPAIQVPSIGAVSSEADYLALIALGGLALAIVLLLVVATGPGGE